MSTERDVSVRRHGVGVAVPRREDRRHLAGQGCFIADVQLTGLCEVAFVRSQTAHGRIREISVPAKDREAVWTAQRLAPFAEPLTATSTLEGFRTAPLPNLAADKVRYVGEPVALAIAATRAEAEDVAGRVGVHLEPLPAVVDFDTALARDAPTVHDDWPDNIFATTSGEVGDVDAAAREAAVSVTREYTLHRQAVVPLETRGVIAHYNRSTGELVVWSSTQTPHMIRDMIALQLGMEARRVRVIAPDMGGGFGAKCSVYPEEITLAAIATQVDHPVRWVEDRWEAQVASTQARDHRHRITAYAAADGTLLGVEADILVNSGAYSVHPWTATMDATMASAMIPGPYRLPNYRFRTRSLASNKTPSGPYRGVARPAAAFSIERTIDELAHELAMEPYEMRIRNMVRSEDMPYVSAADKVYDSGDYPEAVRRATALVEHDTWRERQRALPASARRRIGIGYGSFTEQTAHGCIEWAARGLAVTIGTEGARLAMDATGSLSLSVGIKSHGQGSETTLAQVVSEVFDVDLDHVTVSHGDTAMTPRGDGTFASRTMVMAGGATHGAALALAEKVMRIGAVLLDEPVQDVVLRDHAVVGKKGSVTYAQLAKEFLFTPDHVPGVEAGLEVVHHYRPEVQTGAFTYATQAAVVEVDLDTGAVKLLDYAVVEDCGTVVNPRIVDGQILGGIAQGIGNALLEEIVHDADGQPKSTSFLDYLLPGASEVPQVKIEHMATPSPYTVFGVKGAGEGGAIPPPAAIANAIRDALREYGTEVNETPMTPERVWTALRTSRMAAEAEGRATLEAVR